MDIARRQARINQLVREMLVEGLLNDHFHLVQAIRVAGAAVCAGHLGICSCSIGAQSIQHACRLFMQACAHRSRDQCVGVFYMLRGECSRLLPKFLEVLQNLLRMSSKDVYSASFPVASSLLQVLYQAVAPRYAGDANIVS
ncbi:uncharacterized protein LOC104877766 isoform X7 [Vitis vinifera]|uniref:uncharacterized protein LOC104877766 isoform X7 n=1 Tax=Vitis vinifera TaxID=29760 RepID=UPI0028832C40|nr:uncharacterized protein LOC104877766 isoform X7 [Vitis vinifera]